MARWQRILGGLICTGLLALGTPAAACPNCKDAVLVENYPEDDDPLREARAYNHNIYLMVGMPYLLLATAGFVIYRVHRNGQRKAERPDQVSE